MDSARLKNAVRPADFYQDDARAKQNECITDDIIFTWPREPGEILTPISTPTEYDYRVRHAQAAKDAP